MIGRTVSHYLITERIGAGAMGEVYRADDLQLRRPVALKFLAQELTSDERFKKRFIREAQAASALDHPNVCTIYEIGETGDGRLFIAMCSYEGKSLREHLANGPLAAASAVEYAVGLADGLDRAHRKEILHRDIKPANIHITEDGTPKILDFGLAKLAGRSKVTKTGTSLGTITYMSPEQVRGEHLDERTDIFSLGIVLYEMVTGVCPFQADNEAAVIYKVLNEDPPPPRTAGAKIPERLEGIIARAISKARDDRYGSMAEFRDDLLDALRELSPSRVVRFESIRRSGVRMAKRSKRPLVAGMFVAAVAAAALLHWAGILRFTGTGGLGESKGMAIFPFETATTHSSEIAFSGGLMELLAGSIQKLAEFDPKVWLVPPERFRKSGINTLDQARDAFGIDAILTGKVTEIGHSYRLTLRLLHAGTLRPIEETTIPSTGESGWQYTLCGALAEMLDLALDSTQLASISAGSSGNARALDAYVAGLNLLANETESAFASAVDSFESALALDPSFTDARVGCAEALLKLQALQADSTRITMALSACGEAIGRDSTQARAYFVRAQIMSRLGDKPSALKDFMRAEQLCSRDPEILRQYGWTYIEMGEYDNAESVYQTACERNPDYWGGYEMLGYLYYILGRYDEAIVQFERVTDLAPDHAPTYNYLGALYYILEDWDQAIALFEKSISLGKNYEACTNLGTLYYMKERFEDAARMHEWAWEYDRNDHLVIGNLATAYYWIPEKRERAVELFRQAIDLARGELDRTPDDAVLLSVIAGYYSVTDPDSALLLTEKALSINSNDSEVLYRAALVYEFLDRTTRALVLLGEAIEKGYPLKVIAHERELKNLREDPRYKLLIAKKEASGGA